ncbi:nucleotide exchange factor GrpE [Streptomyces sp. NPDC002466]|uniref:nucleotide exchange factor GrpE n=1 Tax=unclassified Streptomyces TaxID=2593676 RepID=UPI0011E700B4|nr:nucleotide exchange factor GrpE [Streptomyces sp. sk2.1]TXS73895.1 nucleotide exchange factor GrpE [Streptomyces sp. sk2.1]
MSENPHPGRRGERSLVPVRDWRGTAPAGLPPRYRRNAAGTGRTEPKAGTEPRERIAELTDDLQRVKAEYDNYRKQVRRDRLAIREIAVANVLTGLLPVLDVVEEVRGRGDDRGAAALAGVIENRLAALGLRTVGAVGEPFDPHDHEAVAFRASGAARAAVCTEVLRYGYRVGDHLLRPAQVEVTGPAPTRRTARDTADTAPGPERVRTPRDT